MNPNVADALALVSHQTGVSVEFINDSLIVNGTEVTLPRDKKGSSKPRLTGERADLLGIQGLLPTVPHGDDRDKVLWRIIAEAASPIPEASLLSSKVLSDELPDRLGLGNEASHAAAGALRERYFKSDRLLPVHACLPLNYAHTRWNEREQAQKPIRYIMFNGGILPFMLWHHDSGAANEVLMQKLLDTVAQDDELTALDRRFLSLALDGAPRPAAQPDASQLIARYGDDFTASFKDAGGPFCEPSMALFERDLHTVLGTPLPRPERARWLTLVLSLHLSLRLYRIAVSFGSGLDLAVAAAAQLPAPAGTASCTCRGRELNQLASCPFAGRIQFRTGSGHFRPVRMSDGCHSSYKDIDRRRLIDMPAALVTRTLASRAWEAFGGGSAAEQQDMLAMARVLDTDAALRRIHGAACAAITVLHHDAARLGRASLTELEKASRTDASRPGLHALREDVRHMRRRDLHRQGSEVVNQLMLASNVGSGSLLSRNGRSFTFFEVDEELLLLLVRLICQDREVAVEAFLQKLSAYGLSPQDDAERDSLINTLERLGMLERYSDAGEASFVRYA